MTIYVVEPGNTVQSIAQQFGVSVERILIDNELPNPENLVVGQSIVIRRPVVTHTVVSGNTLMSIAAEYNVTVNRLLQNNPWVAAREYLVPGETLVIQFDEEGLLGPAMMNGYAYTFIDMKVLSKQLPFLSELSIFTYGFTPEGELVTIDDEPLIDKALENQVAPIMMLAPMSADLVFNSQIAHELFADPAAEARLIDNIVSNMQQKGYRGLDIDFEFVLPEDKDNFINFIQNIKNRLSPLGLLTMVALAPKTSGEMVGLLYEAHDYPAIGAIADYVLLMTYEWGYTFGPPMATAPLNSVRRVLEYGISVIPREKILMGLPNYAYDWPLPFIRGTTQAESITNQEAVWRASYYNSVIEFDELAQCPYFYYTASNGVEHVVWFDDARSMNAKLRLISEYGLRGGGIWQIMNFFPAMSMIINQLYNVDKEV